MTQLLNLNPELYVVSTPIGNLEDITLRALRILKEVDFILCEDKRVTIKLLNKYNIKTKLISLHKYNEEKSKDEIYSLIQDGKKIALVSDAGTPIISDPGAKLIKFLKEKEINISCVPGPSALTASLSVFGIELKEFLFIGFLPDKKNDREKLLKSFSRKSNFIVLYVAPHDLKKYLNEISEIYSDAYVFLGRELTKIHEEIWSGKINDLLKKINSKNVKGEIVLGIKLNSSPLEEKTPSKNIIISNIKKSINEGASLKEACKSFAKEYNLSSRELYAAYLKNEKKI